MYDLVFGAFDEETTQVVANVFPGATVKMSKMQRQEGGQDCGLFAIAVATAIAHETDPSQMSFHQAAMRSHLAECFSNSLITPFPMSS